MTVGVNCTTNVNSSLLFCLDWAHPDSHWKREGVNWREGGREGGRAEEKERA